MSKPWKLYKKLHRWPGLIIAFFLLYYAVTGIFLNHRELFSGIDISRKVLPANYQYQDWNNAAVKGSLVLNKDSMLLYGNIGIWLTDSSLLNYSPFNSGFPKGIDNRKIYDVHMTQGGDLYAATFSGLYAFNRNEKVWHRISEKKSRRFTAIESISDTLYIIDRSNLYTGISTGVNTKLEKTEILPPPGYVKKVTLFQTLWQIHSGEIFGLPGKVYVDLLGIITLFLSVTGILYFFFPGWIKRRFNRQKSTAGISQTSRWSLKWHNITGSWTFILLLIVFLTGMFLRPPLLIAIAYANVPPLKYSHLDQPNPWYDRLRDIVYDVEKEAFLLSTSEGMYFMGRNELQPKRYEIQPPVSIMGINVFERAGDGAYLIGSFSGIFMWNPDAHSIIDLNTGKPYVPTAFGRPVGEILVSGAIRDYQGNLYLADYNKGVVSLGQNHKFPAMPENLVLVSGMSLWSVCLEIHTGRFFQNIISDFYILIVPLVGLTGILVVLSGYILWKRKHNGVSVARQAKEMQTRVFNQMITTRGRKYTSFLRYLRFFKYIAFAPVRGRFLESYYTLMRYLDDVVDGDTALPSGFASEADYINDKIKFLDNPINPTDDADYMMLYCFSLAEKFNEDFREETRDILVSLHFDAKRRGKNDMICFDDLSKHFHLLDIRGTIRATLKIFKDDPDKYRFLKPLGTACRYQYDLEDFDADVAAGYINIPSEDCKRFGIQPEHFSSLESAPIRLWQKHHAREGMALLLEHRLQMPAGKFTLLQKAIFKVVYEMPAKRTFMKILSE